VIVARYRLRLRRHRDVLQPKRQYGYANRLSWPALEKPYRNGLEHAWEHCGKHSDGAIGVKVAWFGFSVKIMMLNASELKHFVSNRSMPGAVMLDHDREIAEGR